MIAPRRAICATGLLVRCGREGCAVTNAPALPDIPDCAGDKGDWPAPEDTTVCRYATACVFCGSLGKVGLCSKADSADRGWITVATSCAVVLLRMFSSSGDVFTIASVR